MRTENTHWKLIFADVHHILLLNSAPIIELLAFRVLRLPITIFNVTVCNNSQCCDSAFLCVVPKFEVTDEIITGSLYYMYFAVVLDESLR